MAYKVFDNYKTYNALDGNESGTKTVLHSNGDTLINLPNAELIKNADLSRDGYDLVLELNGEIVIVEGYFLNDPAPNLVAPDGTTLTPGLVQSFTQGDNTYADAGLNQNDVSPIGAIQEISGNVTVTRTDGTEQSVSIGTPIFQGDIIETGETGAVNIMFVDETTFAVSEDARLAIDEYVFDASTQSGSSNFSVLKGVFVFTSGLIGRENPDDVTIDTPSGSIGIRGTIIAGDLNTGEITVIEGAIVLTDFVGNSITLSNQFETARFNPSESTIEHLGDLSAQDVASKFSSVSAVAADTFSSVNDVRAETATQSDSEAQEETQDTTPEQGTETNSDSGEESGTESQESAPDENIETDANLDETGEETAETVEMAEDTMMSEDIIEGQNNTTTPNTQQNSNNNNNNSNNTSQNQSGASQNAQQNNNTAEPIDESASQNPSFQITVTRLAFAENDDGSPAVARVTGNFASMTDLELNGISQNFFDVVRESANSFLITVAAGKEIDFEAPKPLNITATSASESIVQSVDLNILNENEFVTGTAAAGTTGINNAFRTGIDSTFTYDFSQEFSDPEGEIIGYNLVTDITGGNTSDPMINSAGILTFETDGITDAGFNFTVQAVTSTGTIDLNTQTFEVLSPTVAPPVITLTGGIFEGTAPNITVAADNAVVFATNPGASNNISILADNAYVKAGVNDDTIEVSVGSSGYRAYGDTGNDTFEISELENGKAYGGAGNDRFILETADTLTQLQTGGTNTQINGDGGFDVLALGNSNTGNINFANVNEDYINNIEALAFQNTQANVINLDYDSVIDMTDGDKTLFITLDDTDTFTFQNTSGNVFVQTGTTDRDGENFNVFTDGEITLLVDTDGNTSGII